MLSEVIRSDRVCYVCRLQRKSKRPPKIKPMNILRAFSSAREVQVDELLHRSNLDGMPQPSKKARRDMLALITDVLLSDDGVRIPLGDFPQQLFEDVQGSVPEADAEVLMAKLLAKKGKDTFMKLIMDAAGAALARKSLSR